MLKNKKVTAFVVAALVLFAAGTVQAADWGTSSIQAGSVVVKSIVHPLGTQSITQSTDPNTLVAGSVACSAGGITTENSYFRLFDLDTDHALTGAYAVQSVDYGIETAVDFGVPQTIQVTTACLPDGMPYLNVFLNEQATEVHAQPDADLEFFNVAASGSCNADDSSLSMELEFPLDCTVAGCGAIFVGSNNLGQSDPSYVQSGSCGLADPTNLAAIGFPDMHLVMIVNGDGTDGNGDGGTDGGQDGPVPASSTIGMIALAILLGSSAFFMRRRVLN